MKDKALEAVEIGNRLKPILEKRIEYIENLQEIECMSKDRREWKEAKDVLKLIDFIEQVLQSNEPTLEEYRILLEEIQNTIQYNSPDKIRVHLIQRLIDGFNDMEAKNEKEDYQFNLDNNDQT